VGDTVGTYEGEVQEAEVRELTAAGPDVEVDVVVQDPRVAAVSIAADRLAQRLLASPLAVAQFFARPVGAVPPLPQTLALGVLVLVVDLADRDDAAAYLYAVNAPEDVVRDLPRVRAHAAPVDVPRLRRLDLANAELWTTNRELGRQLAELRVG